MPIDIMNLNLSRNVTRTGVKHSIILFSFIFQTLPRVQKLMKQWQRKARAIPDQTLRQQALDSLAGKAFHCQGGAVFAAYPLNANLLRFIVAYQTMCDYLDNLCDRAGSTDGQAFRQLHRALLDALDPARSPVDYYKYYPFKNDGGYLKALVEECRRSLEQAVAYQEVQSQLIKLAEWYSSLQTAKHIHLEQREQVLCNWAKRQMADYPDLYWQEFAAATGSTLAIFALLRQAFMDNNQQRTYQLIYDAYFPWICSLHILLDYLIDQEEDRQGGDLNFVFYYDGSETVIERFTWLLSSCYQEIAGLPEYQFHRLVVDGLLAMYLSDSKVQLQGYEQLRRYLLNNGSTTAWRTYHLCCSVRRFL